VPGADDRIDPTRDPAHEPSRRPGASTRKWLASGGYRGHQIFWAGPLRRRKSHRRLVRLSEEAKREPSPIAATTHVRVIEVPETLDDVMAKAELKDGDGHRTFTKVMLGVRPGGGFHMLAVPTEQRLKDEPSPRR
jgi:hypothetical protein